jgi:hypothetical protein
MEVHRNETEKGASHFLGYLFAWVGGWSHWISPGQHFCCGGRRDPLDMRLCLPPNISQMPSLWTAY